MASLLAEARKRVNQSTPIAGRIRPGTKVPTKASLGNPDVMALYEAVLRGDKSFKEAERTLEDRGIKFPFVPKNPRDFRLSPVEIDGGRLVVDRFMELYGTDENINGVIQRKLYRFPVVFPDVPGGVEGFFKSEFAVPAGPIRFHSVYSEEGVRNCIYLKPVDREEQQQAKRKKWLRREPTIRGECHPETCAEFASGACRFRGDLQFYVPGISGVAPFSMPTGSQYAAEDIFLRLEEIYTQCRGQLPRFDRQGNPVFFITKALKQRTYFDQNGIERRGLQWVPVLETSIDMSKVYLLAEKQRLQLASPTPAPANANLPAAWVSSAHAQQSGVVVCEPGATGASAGGKMVEADARILASKPRGVEDALGWIESLGERLNIEDDLLTLVESKWGANWLEREAPLAIRQELEEMLAKLGESFPAYIRLLAVIYQNGVSPDLAMRYLRSLVGSFKQPGSVGRALQSFQNLLKQGREFAEAYMQSEVEKWAKTPH
jgi:hypothetical protein